MLHAGARLDDRYVLLEPVARGGMGEVWRADDTVLGRMVAVKMLLPSLSGEPGFAERFRTEARAMAALAIRTSSRCTTTARPTGWPTW